MDKKELEEAFLAGWKVRDNLFRPANERWNEIRDQKLIEWLIHTDKPLKGTHNDI